MKTIEVVAAIIKHDNKIFTTRRDYCEFETMWEFQGGKIEDGETREEASLEKSKNMRINN